jgi:DNA-binding NtrC family response regulator
MSAESGAGLPHVLYLDDDESLVVLMTTLLGRAGYHVSGATEADTVLAALRAQTIDFDLVVTDYHMPGASGLEVARALRTMRPGMRVVLVSGYVDTPLQALAQSAGVYSLILKPDSATELCELIDDIARAPRDDPSPTRRPS